MHASAFSEAEEASDAADAAVGTTAPAPPLGPAAAAAPPAAPSAEPRDDLRRPPPRSAAVAASRHLNVASAHAAKWADAAERAAGSWAATLGRRAASREAKAVEERRQRREASERAGAEAEAARRAAAAETARRLLPTPAEGAGRPARRHLIRRGAAASTEAAAAKLERVLGALSEEERTGKWLLPDDLHSRVKTHLLARLNAGRPRMTVAETRACPIHKRLAYAYRRSRCRVRSGDFVPSAVDAAMDLWGLDTAWVRRQLQSQPTLRARPSGRLVSALSPYRRADVVTEMALLGYTRFDTPRARWLRSPPPPSAPKGGGARRRAAPRPAEEASAAAAAEAAASTSHSLLGNAQSLYTLKPLLTRLMRVGALRTPTQKRPLRLG